MANILFRFFSLLLLSVSVSVLADEDGEWPYQVRRDDTIWDICKNYVEDKQCWRKLVEYNQIKTPKYLPPGSVVRIPRAWLKPAIAQALVISVVGEVRVTREGEKGERELAVGDKLNQLDTIEAKDGSAMIEFADESRLLLKPNSSVRMQGLRYYQRGSIADTRIRLLKGRVKASVQKLKGMGSRFDIATPAAVAAVRGTEFRVGLASRDDKAVMTAELLEGALKVANDQGEQRLTSGQAVRAVEGQDIAEPVQLLPRPRLMLNQAEEITLPYRLEWYDLKGATGYKVTLSKNQVLVWEMMTSDAAFELDLPEAGEYEVQISAIDKHGFEGRERRLQLTVGDDE